MITWETVENAIAAFVRGATGLAAAKVVWKQGASRPATPWISLGVVSVRPIGHDGAHRQENHLELDPLPVVAFDPATNRLTITGHSLITGDGGLELTTSVGLPPELAVDTPYWAIVIDADTVQLAASLADALDGVPVDFSTAGSGSHNLVGTENTWRLNQEIRHTSLGHREGAVQLQCYGAETTGSNAPLALLERVIGFGALRGQISALSAAGVGLRGFTPATPLPGFGSNVRQGGSGVGIFEPRAVMEMRFFLASEVEEYSTFVQRVEATNQLTGTTRVVELQE